MGCHFLLQCMKVKSESEVTQSCPTPSDPMDHKPTRLLHSWDFPGKSAGVDCHFLLQGIFSTQESKPGLPHCRQMLYRLSHQSTCVFSHVGLFGTTWTLAHQIPLSMEFSRQEYWSRLPFPTPGSLALQADSLPSEPPEKRI